MNGKQQTESKSAGGVWAWIRRNDAVLLVGGLVIAMVQYQTIQMAALVEQVSLRITSLETSTAASLAAFAESQRQIVQQLGLRITAVQENQDRLADQLGQRIASLEKSHERVADQLGGRIGGLETSMASLETRMASLETRMTSLETRMMGLENGVAANIAAGQRSQDRVAGQLGARITSLERSSETGAAALRESQTRSAAQLGARITELDEDVAELSDGMNLRLGRIEDKLGLPPPEAPAAAAASPGAEDTAPG